MDTMLFYKLIFLTIISRWGTMSARIEITPVTIDGLVTTAVNITCAPDKEAIKAKEIVVIQIERGENQIATIRQGSGIQYGKDLISVVEAEGHIDTEVSDSFLRVTMRYLMDANSGKYTCRLYYINDMGFMVDERDDDHLIVDDPDIKSHLRYLIQQKFLQDDLNKDQERKLKDLETELKYKAENRFSVLEKVISDHSNDIDQLEATAENRFSVLEKVISNHSNDIDQLEATARYVSAFTAGYGRSDSFKKGDVVIFDNNVRSHGQGYNKTTGMFTAPRKGMYAFHLTASVANGGHSMQVDVQVNTKVVARTFSYEDNGYDQSSTSCVVMLEPGDVVRAVIEYVFNSGTRMWKFPYSQFTGYLVQPL